MAQIKATTRQELLRLKKNLVQVKSAQKLLEQKRDTLVQEFLKLKGEFLDKKKEIFQKTKEIIALSEFSEKFNPIALLDFLSLNNENRAKFNIEESQFSVMGIKAKIFLLKIIKKTKLDKKISPQSYYDATLKFEEILPKIIELSSLENILTKLATAIEKTRRRVNYLKDIIIPTIKEQIKYLTQRLSDQERESFVFNLKFKKKKIKNSLSF